MSLNAPHLMALLNMAPSAFVGGDIGPMPAMRTLKELRKEVRRQFASLNGQDQEALVLWFNRNFFRLEK